ncbi:carbohydrate kinase family protein [Haloparvum alkalitolerans]|uniref:carbohydrate kinase family protein n=1 Tax=Haloparvum alkalitolerans TaxID=1042953 RepID=UPI003CEB0EF8
MSSPSVVVVGGAMLDDHYAVTNLPEPDGGAFAPDVETGLGGVGANVAVALARLGRDVGLVSRLGDDDTAEEVRRRLADTAVDTDRVRTGSGQSTRSLVFRNPAGERMIVTTDGQFRHLEISEADLAYMRGADAVFLTAYTPDAATSTVLDAAADPGFPPVAFDLSGPLEELADRGTTRESAALALDRAALFVSGSVAAPAFVDGDLADARERFAAAGCPRVALTAGEEGATLFANGDRVSVDAFDVDPVDTTGAGDAFIAALVDRWLLAKESATAAGRFAAATAAINCTTEFAQPGLPTREEVGTFLADRGLCDRENA